MICAQAGLRSQSLQHILASMNVSEADERSATLQPIPRESLLAGQVLSSDEDGGMKAIRRRRSCRSSPISSIAARIAQLVVVFTAATWSNVAPASATFPGADGKIAFVRDGDIWVVRSGDSQTIRLTHTVARDSNPAWSPDGQMIAFDRARRGHHVHIFIMAANGTSVTRVTRQVLSERDPAWSPDGQRLVFSKGGGLDRELCTVRLDGSDLRRVTTNDGDDLEPDWSPDGEWIAYESLPSGGGALLSLIRPDGSEEHDIALGPGVTYPTWSPDSSHIAFTSLDDAGGEGGSLAIAVIDVDGSNEVLLAKTRHAELTPSWSPGGDRIAFVRDLQLHTMKADGSDVARVTTAPRGYELAPAWQPRPS